MGGGRGEDAGFRAGDRVATLASLSLTPLRSTRINAVRHESAQVDVEGSAVVFFSAPLAKMPTDLPERLALALLDVAGAAPQIARHVTPGDRVVVLGAGGKSGLLCCAEARRRVGPDGSRARGSKPTLVMPAILSALGLCDQVIDLDATEALRVREAVVATQGREADLVVSCVNVAGAEPTAILLTRPRGQGLFLRHEHEFHGGGAGRRRDG